MTIYQKINQKTDRYEYQNLKIFYQEKMHRDKHLWQIAHLEKKYCNIYTRQSVNESKIFLQINEK